MNLKWKFIYLGRHPSPSPLLSPDVLADVDVVDLKLSIMYLKQTMAKSYLFVKYYLKNEQQCFIRYKDTRRNQVSLALIKQTLRMF